MKGYYVISDRFHDSSTAYQGFGRGLSIEAIMNIHNLAIGDTIPDITFFIDIPVEEAENRKMQKLHHDLDRIEIGARDFFEKVRNGYLYLSKDKRFRKIDGMQPIQEMHKQIIREIELLEKRQKT
jgi:dTMP kinase